MIETHRDPVNARSDAKQQITPATLRQLLDSLIIRDASPGQQQQSELADLRDLIDQLDDEIIQKLSSRMDIAERIGDFKKAHNVAILQPERFDRIVRRLLSMTTDLKLSPRFITDLMNAVHEESIRRQHAVPDPDQGIASAGRAVGAARR